MASVFLCHSSQDRKFVERLASDLSANGVDVWFDRWEIKVGDSVVAKISEGICSHDYLAIILTPNSVRSKWVQLELNVALMKELDKQQVVVLPILAEACTMPPLIAEKRYANFTGEYYSGLIDLLSVLLPDKYDLCLSPSIEIVDAHAHLWFEHFDSDLDHVVSRARVSGVRRIVVSGCSGVLSWAKCIHIAERYEGIYVSIGLHPSPWRAIEEIDLFEKFARHPRVVALGDAFLDYRYTFRSHKSQANMLNLHFDTAERLDLPLVVRVVNAEGNRDAEEDFWEILKPRRHKKLKLIFESPSSMDFANKCRDLGYYIMVEGNFTFSRADSVRSIVKQFPIERIVLASDCPFISPEPVRKLKRNEPYCIRYILDAMEKVLPYKAQDIARITTCTAENVFKFDECDKRVGSLIPEPFTG